VALFSRRAVLLLLAFAARAALGGSAHESVRLKAVVAEALPCRTNLISNSSFEQTGPHGVPHGWQWNQGKTSAACVTDRAVSHSGRQSIFITNGTAFGPNVYGMLWRTEPAKLTAGRPYTMSAWVKSDEPGGVELIGGGDWLQPLEVRLLRLDRR
jgi:hypothetical protein